MVDSSQCAFGNTVVYACACVSAFELLVLTLCLHNSILRSTSFRFRLKNGRHTTSDVTLILMCNSVLMVDCKRDINLQIVSLIQWIVCFCLCTQNLIIGSSLILLWVFWFSNFDVISTLPSAFYSTVQQKHILLFRTDWNRLMQK